MLAELMQWEATD
ncbi:hypothetical protein SS209_02195 [Salmonella enterica subsp. enterica serovar Senftenberg str. SS209]|nr:hypothetical protein SS209_02195 [Salmonella enterica subsp. enterica serovar Senftenberg str. SS209]